MSRSIQQLNYMFQYNPPVPCGLFFTKASDESIFHFRSSYLACFLFKEKCPLRFANSADLSLYGSLLYVQEG